jgi:chromate transporter
VLRRGRLEVLSCILTLDFVSAPEKQASTIEPARKESKLPIVSGRAILGYFLRLGALGFGGPIALAGAMHRDLVDQRRWVTEEEYRDGLALAQLAPGPLAAQLAIYLGWARGRVLGATLAGVGFVLPSFLMVLGLSVLYVRVGGLPWMRGVFYGVSAAVIAIIARSVAKLARASLRRDPLLWGLFLAAAVVTAATATEIVWVFLAAGVVTVLVRRGGSGTGASVIPWALLLSGPALPAAPLAWQLFWYFGEASLFVFGSGLAIVPFLHAGVVETRGWLTEQQFLDAVAVAMITPGPVVITVAFIGFLVAGFAGAFAAGLGMFLPTYLVVLLAAPYYERLKSNRPVRDFVDGITAATTGGIAGAAVVLGRNALSDWPAWLLAVATLALLLRTRLPEPMLIAGAGVVGLAIGPAAR